MRRGAADHLLGLRVLIPLKVRTYVSCECCASSVNGLCDGPIPRQEEPFACVCVCVRVCACVRISLSRTKKEKNDYIFEVFYDIKTGRKSSKCSFFNINLMCLIVLFCGIGI